MRIAMIGLGRMGASLTRRLVRGGHEVVVYDHNATRVAELATEGALPAPSLEAVISALAAPRIFWLMLPAGTPTEETILTLGALAHPGDIIIDGGNSYFKDDIRRASVLQRKNLHYVDIGTSGGIHGLERGYCLMVGGEEAIVEFLDPILATLSPGLGTIPRTPGRISEQGNDPRAELGYIHAGPAGAGHFVKMVHNGIEYGLMQAYAEGFDILKQRNSDKIPADERLDLNLADIAEVWRRGSVVSSWLLDLTAAALATDVELAHYTGQVADSGEGQWTIETAMEESVPANVLSAALFERYRSRFENGFGDKLLSAMRFGFGGHIERR
jgi:6-phosphogluconate dehydrogenase